MKGTEFGPSPLFITISLAILPRLKFLLQLDDCGLAARFWVRKMVDPPHRLVTAV